MNSDPLMPIIILNPILNGRVSTYTVKLYPCIAEGVYKMSKLGPDRNNVRDTSAADQGQYHSDENIIDITFGAGNPPTPHYNNALLLDMNGYQRHLNIVFNASEDCTAFADAEMLFKVWLRQRELYHVCAIMVAKVLEIHCRVTAVLMAF